MYYEINVALNGRHFFATAERSICNEEQLKKVLTVLKQKFPVSEGYELYATRYENRGFGLSID